jgi:hypothetical protein
VPPRNIYQPFVVFELWNGRDGDFDSLGIRRYARVFGVFTDVSWKGPLNLSDVTGLPTFGSTYQSIDPNDPQQAIKASDVGAVLRQISFQQDNEDPLFWKIYCRYSNEVNPRRWPESAAIYAPTGGTGPQGATGGSINEADPTKRTAFVKIRSVRYRVPMGYDDPQNKGLLNSAGDPVTPPPEKDAFYLEFNVVRNAAAPTADIEDYLQCINSVTFMGAVDSNGTPIPGTGYTPGQVRLADYSCDAFWENEKQFWTEEFVFEVRPNTAYTMANGCSPWALFIIDQGFHVLDANGKPYTPLDQYNHPISQPIALDGTGQKLVKGQPLIFIGGVKGIEPYPQKDFNALNIVFPPIF